MSIQKFYHTLVTMDFKTDNDERSIKGGFIWISNQKS
jgi:hypothetical protein